MAKQSQFVALLRGINVGGNNIIKMSDLQIAFIEMGFTNVRTLLASGNVIFTATGSARELEEKIEVKLRRSFRYAVKVLVRSSVEIHRVVEEFPETFSNTCWRHNVIFLADEINSKSLLKSLQVKRDIEQVAFAKGVLYWSAEIKAITKSNMLKLSTKPEYQHMTVRSPNTVRRIQKMLESL